MGVIARSGKTRSTPGWEVKTHTAKTPSAVPADASQQRVITEVAIALGAVRRNASGTRLMHTLHAKAQSVLPENSARTIPGAIAAVLKAGRRPACPVQQQNVTGPLLSVPQANLARRANGEDALAYEAWGFPQI
jgi:hypothetical protein